MLSHLLSNGAKRHPVPRDTPDDEVEKLGGRDWVRNFPRLCPFCKRKFYSWAPWPWPRDWTPNTEELVHALRPGMGHRETCGRPECILDAQWEFDLWEQDFWNLKRAEKRERDAAAKGAQQQDQKYAEETF